MPNFPKTEKIEVRLRQDLADRLPKEKGEKNVFINRAVENELNGVSDAASIMGKMGGSVKSIQKTIAARENAKKPRPRKKPEII
jgi:hypothetical protein